MNMALFCISYIQMLIFKETVGGWAARAEIFGADGIRNIDDLHNVGLSLREYGPLVYILNSDNHIQNMDLRGGG